MKKEQLEEYVIEQRIEDGIRKGLSRWVHIVCRTATTAILGGFYWIGALIYEKWIPLQAAIKAFLEASRQ